MATAGLTDVVATSSSICDLDGKAGKLRYYGLDIADLAEHSTFEETVYLLWYGKLPTKLELDSLDKDLISSRHLPPEILSLIRSFPRTATPMEVLRTIVSALSIFDPDNGNNSREANVRKATRLVAQFPTIVAAEDRIRRNLEPVAPKAGLNHAANFLYMMTGEEPDAYKAHVMDVALILHADHELNASTFAARVTAGTLADMYASVTSAIGALSGPLHGGANEQVMKMLLEINEPSKVDDYISSKLASKEKVMGFGHRVYKTADPRATILQQYSRELGERASETKWYTMSKQIEAYMISNKNLNANVDFFSASTYYQMGLPIDLFTPIFAVSRISGWTAHILEQYANNKLIRPVADYEGPGGVPYIPIDQR